VRFVFLPRTIDLSASALKALRKCLSRRGQLPRLRVQVADTARRCRNNFQVYWKCLTAERISTAPYGFGTKRLSLGNSLLFGGVNPVTTIKWIGGHLSLIAAANRSPSIEPGMLISVMTSWISRTLSST
jgi:hypothetical protein